MTGREQVRTILQHVQSKDLLDIFNLYLEECQLKIAVKWHQRSDKVIEVSISARGKLIKSIGSTKNEALAEAARIFLEGLLGNEAEVLHLKQCIKKGNACLVCRQSNTSPREGHGHNRTSSLKPPIGRKCEL